MNKIVIITTSGCTSCDIVVDKIRKLITEFKGIGLSIKDKDEVKKSFLKNNKITDFPTGLFYRDDDIVFKFTGNYPAIVFIQWIHNFLVDLG